MDFKRIVARGYDRIADEYLKQRQRTLKPHMTSYLDRVMDGLPAGARVLDLGCGPGVPYAAYMSERFDVVGLDISQRQLALARSLVPRAGFVLADLCSPPFKPASFDGIVALYSIIHVPREEHEALFGGLRGLLRPGGRLLAVLGARAWEGTEQGWLVPGVEMFWSHFGADTYLRMVERTGFRLLLSALEPDPLDGGAHLFVVAERLS